MSSRVSCIHHAYQTVCTIVHKSPPLFVIMYNKTKKSALHRYFDTCFMHNIGGVSDTRWYDSLASSIRYSSYILRKRCVKLTEWGGLFVLVFVFIFNSYYLCMYRIYLKSTSQNLIWIGVRYLKHFNLIKNICYYIRKCSSSYFLRYLFSWK